MQKQTRINHKQPISRRQVMFNHQPLPPEFPVLFYYDFINSDDVPAATHFHDCLEIGLCHEGSGVFFIGEKVEQFNTGDVAVFPPNAPHFAQSTRGTVSRWTYIMTHPALLLGNAVPDNDGLNRLVVLPRPQIMAGPAIGGVRSVIDEIIQESREQQAGWQNTIRHLFAIAQVRIARRDLELQAQQDPGRRAGLDRVLPALLHVSSRYHEKINVATLARTCNVGSRHFTRLLLNATGKTPAEYINQVRVAMACGGLRDATAKISTVAMANGFESVSSFNRQFRAHIGMSPREWRYANLV